MRVRIIVVFSIPYEEAFSRNSFDFDAPFIARLRLPGAQP
jgi:hypothetical protein